MWKVEVLGLLSTNTLLINYRLDKFKSECSTHGISGSTVPLLENLRHCAQKFSIGIHFLRLV